MLIRMLATLSTVVALALFFQRDVSDFRMFYDSGSAFLDGRPLYHPDYPNLQPPSVTALVFAPLAQLPYRPAQILWTLLGAVSLIASTRLIARALHWTRDTALNALALLLASYAAASVWFQGQIIWLLLYPCTRAWMATRAHRWQRAGCWLAPVIAVKPSFAVTALLLPSRCWMAAGALSAALSAITIPLTGWQAWQDWRSATAAVSWLAWPDNASLWGAAARLQSGHLLGGRVSDLPLIALAPIALVAALGAWRMPRDPDRRVAGAILLTVLVMPLGWVAYVPLTFGPLAATWTRGTWLAYALIAMPLPALYPLLTHHPLAVRTLGSLYTLGVCSAWVVCAHPEWLRGVDRSHRCCSPRQARTPETTPTPPPGSLPRR